MSATSSHHSESLPDSIGFAELRTLYESAPILMGIVELSEDDILHVYDNPATSRFFGTKPRAMAGKWASELGAPRSAIDLWIEHYRIAEAAGEPIRFEYSHESPEGMRWMASTVAVLTASTDGTRFYYLTEDITDRRAAEDALRERTAEKIEREQQLMRAQGLASLGTLIAGVAHELASPLQAIINFAQGLLMDDRAEEDREVLEIIEREAHRMASIVADLKNVARSAQEEETEKLAVDLNEVVRHILKVQDYRLKMSNVEVREDLPDDLPKVLADRAKLEQVVLNLVVNAEQAMSSSAGEGRLILRTRASAKGVALHVVDNGPGISANQLENIFDPFFTTKEPGEGTGLGLSLVKDLVNDHDGEIRVDSEVGSGSAFCVDWPRASALPLNAESTAAHEISVQPLRILVVDDEPAIRHVTGRYLRRRGHTVEEAGDGVAALELVESGSYDVILTDLRMPGLSGDSMAERLKEKGLADKVVFMTGALSGGTESLARMGVPVLLKPVNSQEIARAVEMVGRRFAN